MNSKIKTILTGVVAALTLTSVTKAGNYCYQPTECCNAGTCCDNTGYVFAYGGWTTSSELSGSSVELGYPGAPTTSTFNTIFDYDGDFIAGGGVGVYSCFLGGSRFEIEGLYSENDLASVSANGALINGYTGRLKSKAFFLNALKEIPLGCFTGYVGGGVGYTVNNFSFRNTTIFNSNFADSGEDSALSCQFIAGVDVPVSDCLALFFQYKLMNIGEMEFDCTDPNATNAAQRKTVNIDSYIQHALVVGARVSF